MENNQLNIEIERKANERIKTLTIQEIEERAMLEKKATIKNRCIWIAVLVVCALAWITNLCQNPEDDSFWFMLLLSIFAIIGIVILLVDLNKTLHKSNDDLALVRLKKELKKSGVIVSSQQSNTKYNVSKSIDIAANGKKTYRLMFDNDNKVFQLQEGDALSKLYKFTDVINYEVYENGASQVSGTAGAALIGGAFFGLGGMILGSSMGRTVQGTCSQLKLIIRLNDIDNPQMEIYYVSSGNISKDSSDYKKKIENLQLVCSQLEYMINSKTLEESSKTGQSKAAVVNDDIKQQILTLQEMFKDGLITEEEFEQKKKQLLGL